MARVLGSSAAAAFSLAVLLVAGSMSCGGSKGPGPSTGDTGGGGGGDGSGSGSSGGGTGDGSGGTTAGGGSGGTSGGTSGGGAQSACAALVATPDAGHAHRFDVAGNESCYRATSNPNGQIALGVASAGRGTGSVTFHLYPPDGSAEQGSVGLGLNGGADIDPWFHWTNVGWAGLSRRYASTSPYPYFALGSYDDRGTMIGQSADAMVNSAPDGHGGTVLLAQSVGSSGPGGPTALQWLDARGTLLRAVTLDADARSLLVNWSTDHVLVIGSTAGAPHARWYDAAGVPLTAWFPFTAPLATPTLHLLLDGTIALGDVNGWSGLFRDGVGGMDPPPAWLAARPGTRLATIRGGRGYAVLPWYQNRGDAGVMPRHDRFEIVTPSGESCGTVTTPAARDEAGVTRTATNLEVGQDGTLVEADFLSGSSLGTGNHCEFRWWPALLQ